MNARVAMSTSSSTSSLYRILIADRAYTSWSFENVETDRAIELEPDFLPPDFHPATYKLFTKDVLRGLPLQCDIVHSPVRTTSLHAGVLQLSENRTFGRGNKRLLYKCIPDEKYLPAFLIPYEIQLGFSKNMANKFVVFKFTYWTDKHPHGQIVETLGNVDCLEAFYEYQLYCKSLHDSITRLTQDARTALNRAPIETYIAQIREKHDVFEESSPSDVMIFSIDPPHSLDFDDAVSVMPIQQSSSLTKEWKVSIYIANVALWLDELDLWNSLTNRVATIYLPDRRRPMLPTVLSDSLCSLQEREDRFAFICDMVVDATTIRSATFRHGHVRVAKNYRYEEKALLALRDYQTLFEITQRLDANCKDSHDVVAFWMIETNARCAEHFTEHKLGIFRAVVFTPPTTQTNGEDEALTRSLTPECRRTIQMWNNTTGQYVCFNETSHMKHDVLKKSAYVHMTSPIRRLVDLLNQMMFLMRFLDVKLSPSASTFLDTWIRKMDFVNVSMRSIRKVQNDCHLVCRCTNEPELLEGMHRCVVFDRIERGTGYFNYMVYMESLNLLSRVRTTKDLRNYDVVQCKLLVFENEERTKRKIRLSIQD